MTQKESELTELSPAPNNPSQNTNLWSHFGYFSWFTADTSSAAGTAIRTLAISLLGYAVSGSTVAAGWLGTTAMIAQQGASLFGGTYVDRHNRKHLVIVNAAMGTLIWGTIAILLAAHTLTFPTLMTLSTLASAINGFLGSATDAMLRTIIDIQNYSKARSLNEGRDATLPMTGGPIGGFLYGIGAWLPFLVSAILYAVSGAAASGLPAQSPGSAGTNMHNESKSRTSFFHDLVEGWTWSLRRRTIVTILIAAALVNFGVNGIQYAIQLHMMSAGISATFIGMISGGISLAMLPGSLAAGKLSNKASTGRTVCLAFAFMCVCAITMTFADNYWLALATNSLMGLPFPIINAMLLGFVFAKSPENMQGRITVTLSTPAQVLSTFCSAAAGTLLPVLSFRGTVLVFATVLIAGAAIVLCSPSVRQIPQPSRWKYVTL